MTEAQKRRNKAISATRVRVEHVFGHMTKAMGGITVSCVGIARARARCALRDLAYNMHRITVLPIGYPIGAAA